MGKKTVAYFKRSMIIFIGLVSFIVSFIVSIWLHEKVYGKNAPSFARLRGGPAIGTALVSLSSFANIEALRAQYDNGLTTNDIILGESMAFLSVGAGVLAADMRRGWKGE